MNQWIRNTRSYYLRKIMPQYSSPNSVMPAFPSYRMGAPKPQRDEFLIRVTTAGFRFVDVRSLVVCQTSLRTTRPNPWRPGAAKPLPRGRTAATKPRPKVCIAISHFSKRRPTSWRKRMRLIEPQSWPHQDKLRLFFWNVGSHGYESEDNFQCGREINRPRYLQRPVC
jgi:hypothetical protein